MSSTLALRIDQLTDAGFSVKIVDGGIIAYLYNRKPSRHELIGAVPELEGCLMEMRDAGVYISIGDE